MELKTKPIDDGFWLPAAFAENQAGYMIWPQRPDNWRNGGKPAQRVFTQLAGILAQREPITMLVNESQYKNAKSMLPESVQVIEMSSDDAFIKDTGPFYVVNKRGDIRVVDFNFNAWGGLVDGLYFPWAKDNELAIKMADLDRLDYYRCSRVLESCSVMSDGEGTLYTTEDVILSESRNPSPSKAEAEKVFHDYFGIKKVVWLKEGFFLDEVGGDIDNMLNIIRPGEVVLSWTDDQSDPMYAICRRAEAILKATTDARGRSIIIHRMQLPAKQLLSEEEANGVDPINGMLPRVAGQRLPATYVNYIATDHMIVIPEFNDPQDEIARKQLASLYPERKIFGFPAREVLTGGGGLHTIVLSVPGKQTGGLR